MLAIAITTGTDNTLVGYDSGVGVTGSHNIILGEDPSSAITSGSSNILIGNSLSHVTNTSSNQLDIGDTIYGTLGGGGTLTLAGALTVTGTVSGPIAATTLSASSTVSGAGFTTYLASPPAIGGTAAAAGTFTSLAASSTITDTQAIGATSTDGLILTDPTAATSANQKWSPRIRLTGQGWKTTATAGSQETDWIVENQPVQGTTHPTSNLVFSDQVNAGGYGVDVTFDSAGDITAIGAISGTTLTSTISTGTAPFTVTSTTNVANLNASTLSGATFASPGAIGGTTASTAHFTTLNASGAVTFSGLTNADTGDYVCYNGGTIEFDATACVSSLRRLKQDIVPLTGGLAEAMLLQPMQFRYRAEYKHGDRLHVGFIAEDVEKVDPRIAAYTDNGVLESVDYQHITAIDTAAIQELQKEIVSLFDTAKDLAAKFAALATKVAGLVSDQAKTFARLDDQQKKEQDDIAAHQNDITDLKQLVAAKQKEITDLKQQIRTLAYQPK